MSGRDASLTVDWWRPRNAMPAGQPPAAPALPRAGGSRVAFGALLAFIVILVLSPQTAFPVLQPLRLAFVAAAVAVIAYLMQRMATRQPLLEMSPPLKYCGAILAWAVATVPMSYWPGGSVSFLFEVYLKTLVIFVLLAHVVDSEARLRRLAWVLSLMTVPLALSGIGNYLSGTLHEGRILGYNAPLTANPNDLALTLNLFLPLTIGLFLESRRTVARLVLLGIMGLSVCAVVVTFSRSGFLTLAVIGAVYGWRLLWRRQHGLVMGAVVVLFCCLPLVPSSYVERLATITDIEADRSGSAQARWSDTLAALEFVGQNPLVGAGIGQNELAMNEVRGPTWLNIHNSYLEYAVELGLPGLVLYLLLIRSTLGAAGRAQQAAARARAPTLFYLSESVRVALYAFLVAALFHPTGYDFYFYLFAGLALAAQSIARRPAEGA